MEQETRNCQNCKKDFTIESDDFSFYEKVKAPLPTFCPECRLVRRLTWRNDRYLSKVNCKLCGNSTFSTLREDSGFIIYCTSCFVGDAWNPLNYGVDYDFSKPFFEQFSELIKKVPMRSRFVSSATLINSEYTSYVSNLKNCYLIYNSDYDENCIYGSEIENSKDCIDNTMIDGCEQSYENVNCQKCYKIFFSTDCIESSDVWFSYDLVGCMNCFGCVGLRNKSYHIFNQPYSKTEYQEKIKEFSASNVDTISRIERKVKEIYLKTPRRYVHGRQNTNTSGEYIYNSKEVKKSYIVKEAQNCKYSMWLIVPTVKDCWDYTEYGDKAEQIYEAITAGVNVSRVKFSNMISRNSMDVEYSYGCSGVQNVFGCVGLRKKQYCIFNKQYTKEEYEELLPKIKKHMDDMPYLSKKGIVYKYGEFFPSDISPYAYNQTTAQEFFPLNKHDIEDKGYSFQDIVDKNYVPTITKENLPDSINNLPDSFINEIIECAEWGNEESKMRNCTKAFRVTANELAFYKNHGISLPHKCPNCRHYDRIQRRNPITLWHRKCMCDKEHKHHTKNCEEEFETSYAPGRPEIVYCERCYQQEIY
jgi:hypothetical protein